MGLQGEEIAGDQSATIVEESVCHVKGFFKNESITILSGISN
jgi:hypothetical protein